VIFSFHTVIPLIMCFTLEIRGSIINPTFLALVIWTGVAVVQLHSEESNPDTPRHKAKRSRIEREGATVFIRGGDVGRSR